MADLTERPRPARSLEVAPRLLGATFTHGGVTVRLTEVEAYDGPNDPGSHAHNGRTERNAVMFGPPGHLYVYFTYGMHHCCNVVVRARRRGRAPYCSAPARSSTASRSPAYAGRGSTDRDLARGPGRLCKALGIDRADNGLDLRDVLVPGPVPSDISTGPRVGLRKAAERPWRFWITGEPTVSRYVAAKPRVRRGKSPPSAGPDRHP